jgi:hypothetical protein
MKPMNTIAPYILVVLMLILNGLFLLNIKEDNRDFKFATSEAQQQFEGKITAHVHTKLSGHEEDTDLHMPIETKLATFVARHTSDARYVEVTTRLNTLDTKLDKLTETLETLKPAQP